MKRIEMRLAVGVVLSLVMAACSGSGSATAQIDPVDSPATATVVAVETPTAEPEAATVSADDLIAAALAAYEAAPQPTGTIAWDVIDSSISDDLVSFTMCTWDGESAFDQVRDVRYQTTVAADDEVTATNVQSSPTSGDCLNTTLINSAIEAINTHDAYWSQVLLDPASFADDPTGKEIFTEETHGNLITLTNQWIEDDVHFKGSRFEGITEEALEAPIAWRRHRDAEQITRLAFALCRTMDADYGLYRGDTLLDDYKEGSIRGPHSIALYEFVADSSTAIGWRVDEVDGLAWGDCFNTGDWLDAVSIWQSEPSSWELLDR